VDGGVVAGWVEGVVAGTHTTLSKIARAHQLSPSLLLDVFTPAAVSLEELEGTAGDLRSPSMQCALLRLSAQSRKALSCWDDDIQTLYGLLLAEILLLAGGCPRSAEFACFEPSILRMRRAMNTVIYALTVRKRSGMHAAGVPRSLAFATLYRVLAFWSVFGVPSEEFRFTLNHGTLITLVLSVFVDVTISCDSLRKLSMHLCIMVCLFTPTPRPTYLVT
jgi:hypothetical protein